MSLWLHTCDTSKVFLFWSGMKSCKLKQQIRTYFQNHVENILLKMLHFIDLNLKDFSVWKFNFCFVYKHEKMFQNTSYQQNGKPVKPAMTREHSQFDEPGLFKEKKKFILSCPRLLSTPHSAG